MFFDEQSLTNVQTSLIFHTNTGTTRVNEVGKLPGMGMCWLYCEGIANILLFYKLQYKHGFENNYTRHKNKFGKSDPSFVVKYPAGKVFCFSPDDPGLHSLDCSNYFGVSKNGHVFGSSVTVDEHKLFECPSSLVHNNFAETTKLMQLTGVGYLMRQLYQLMATKPNL